MKMFDLKGTVLGLNKPNIVSLLNSIELHKGKTMPVKKAKKLDMLKAMARRSSAVMSNQIGNVYITEEREHAIFVKSISPYWMPRKVSNRRLDCGPGLSPNE